MAYENDIFYNTQSLSLTEKVAIIEDAFALKTEWWVDILDCSVSWARQRIEMSFEDILLKFHSKAHFIA